MIKRTFQGVIQLLGVLGAGLAIALLALAWRLSTGPISLAFLSPYVTDALSAVTPGYRITVDDTILTWAGWDRTLDIRVVNARAIGSGDAVIASVPELSLSLSAQALLRGQVALRSIELYRPDMRLVRRRDGRFEVGFGKAAETSQEMLSRGLADLLAVPDEERVLSFLSRVRIIDANLIIEDRRLHTFWRAPATQVNLRRDTDGIKGEIALDLLVEDEHARLAIVVDYRAAEGKLDLGIGFDEVNPAVFSRLSPALQVFDKADLPLSGSVTLSMSADGAVHVVGFEVSGGRGRVALPAPLAQSIDVEKIEMRGRYHGAGERLEFDRLFVDERLEFDRLFVDLGADGRIRLPASTNHVMPLRSLSARGRFLIKEKRLEIGALKLDLLGPEAELSGTIDGLGGDMTVDAKGTLVNLPVDDLKRYWPRAWATDARKWVVANLSRGVVKSVNAALALRSDGRGGFEVVSLEGDMALDGISVDYLAPMPKAHKAGATARFDKTRFDITLMGGEAQGLTVRKGRILFTGLDAEDQYADIELFVDGPVTNALRLIDHEPLGWVSELGIVPADTRGTASAHLKLRFIVEHALTMDQVDIVATAALKDVTVADALLGRALHGGQLDLRADKEGMDVTGSVMLGDLQATMSWRENFGDRRPFRSRYGFRGTIADVKGLGDLGLAPASTQGDYIQGAIGVDVGLTIFEGQRGRLEATVDLTDAVLALPAFGWTKARGVAGTALINAQLQGTRITDAPRIDITAGDLTVAASALYAADGSRLERIDFERLTWGKNDVSGWLLSRADGGWDAHIRGASIDLEPLWTNLLEGDPAGYGDESGGPRFNLDVDIGRVWLGPGRFMDDVRGVLVNDGSKWQRLRLEARVGEGRRFAVNIRPRNGGKRTLAIHADDAGAALRVFDYYDDMIGGTMDVTGEYDDTAQGSPLTGRLNIRDYRVIRAPALAHLVSILALTGIIDALGGEGLAFSELVAPFGIRNGVVEVNDAKATGTSLGFTASGKFYTDAEVMQVEGTVVPAYLINAIWGHIPLLGTLLTGGEEGGGVFAATYKMTGPKEDPEVVVNPLSALAPGFLRHLLGVFGPGGAVPQAPDTKRGGPENP